jgi:hypothetical protein
MTGKCNDFESMPCKSAYAKVQLLQSSTEMSISAGSVAFQGCSIRNQFCTWRLLKIKSKYQVQNQCDVITLICTSTDNFGSPINYVSFKNGLDET